VEAVHLTLFDMNMMGAMMAASKRRGTLKKNLAHWWDLGSGGGAELDLVGTVNLSMEGTTTTGVAPDGGGCLNCGAGAGRLITGDIDELVNYGQNWSLSIWSRHNAGFSAINNTMAGQSFSANSVRKFRLLRGAANGPSSLVVSTSFNSSAQISVAEHPSGWYMNTAVRRGATIEFWINGTLLASGAYSGRPVTGIAKFGIGRDGGDGDSRRFHRGLLFACGMWGRALEANEISTLYNNGQGKRFANL
jgi:hypothetical protein